MDGHRHSTRLSQLDSVSFRLAQRVGRQKKQTQADAFQGRHRVGNRRSDQASRCVVGAISVEVRVPTHVRACRPSETRRRQGEREAWWARLVQVDRVAVGVQRQLASLVQPVHHGRALKAGVVQPRLPRRSCALLAHVAGALALREGGAVAGAGAGLKPATNSRALCAQESQADRCSLFGQGEAEPNSGGA